MKNHPDDTNPVRPLLTGFLKLEPELKLMFFIDLLFFHFQRRLEFTGTEQEIETELIQAFRKYVETGFDPDFSLN